MSVTEYANEPNPQLWEMYLSDMRALAQEHKTELHPSVKDYNVWLQDQNIDLGEIERA